MIWDYKMKSRNTEEVNIDIFDRNFMSHVCKKISHKRTYKENLQKKGRRKKYLKALLNKKN